MYVFILYCLILLVTLLVTHSLEYLYAGMYIVHCTSSTVHSKPYLGAPSKPDFHDVDKKNSESTKLRFSHFYAYANKMLLILLKCQNLKIQIICIKTSNCRNTQNWYCSRFLGLSCLLSYTVPFSRAVKPMNKTGAIGLFFFSIHILVCF